MIEQWGYGPQEMEFTFESPSRGDFYFLQSRDMALRERPTVYSFDLTDQAAAASLGRGIGVSGGGVSGRLVFSLEDIRAWRDKDPTAPLILVRGDTAPDDIKEIFEADGLLTARGGSTSHAAIVAHRLNKTCVVGCADLICDESTKTCRLGEARLGPGDWVSIDGLDGAVYLGQVGGDMKVKERRTV
jgi:pyruvate,orthophosphate dikinase